MTRTASLGLILIAASSMALAQTQSSGGWRRVGDPAPAAVPAPVPPPSAIPSSDQDPTQPVARADEYGQPQVQAPARAPAPLPGQEQPPENAER